jgi:hypothetical protein
VYVGTGDNYEQVDPKGKIVLIDGLSNPRLAKLSETQGAIGQVFINDNYAHEGIVSVIWGTPTPETIHLLPKTPCINITAPEGEQLIQLLKQGPVRVRMKTKAWIGWRKIPVVTADLKGPEEDFVLLSGHIDSWHYGAMDNGSANATMIEVARIVAKHKDDLRRGLRVAFWSGHSHGRYSGSAWYADNFWEDLYEHCAAHVNVDSVGAKGAALLSEAYVMAEARGFASSIVAYVSGQKLKGRRFARAGDQSFWGLGLPAMFMSLSEQPPEANKETTAPSFVFGPHSGGLGWWWHTQEDTVDKIDPANLVRDAGVYLLVVHELCSANLLPFDYSATVKEMAERLKELQGQSGGFLGISSLVDRAEKLKELVATFNQKVAALNEQIQSADDNNRSLRESTSKINETLKTLGRLLVPVNYGKAGMFDHDLAVPTPPVPVLEQVADLPKLDRDSDEFRFLVTRLKRESNKVAYAFLEAEKCVTTVLKEL